LEAVTKKRLLAISLLVSLALVALLVALRPRRMSPLEVGEMAPNFTLPALLTASADASASPSHGKPASGYIRLGNYRRQVVLVNFWATWCPPCVEEAPSLEKFAEQMRSQGAIVIGVSVDQDRAALEKFVAHYQFSFPVARDPDQAVAARYGTFKFPETYIIDRDGRVAEKIVGALDWQDPRMVNYVRGLAGPGERASR
jgi:peroxiredoxin